MLCKISITLFLDSLQNALLVCHSVSVIQRNAGGYKPRRLNGVV